MIELGISKMALIGAIALIVIGPEKLPRVARTVGALLGKAQRYVADVRAEVNRSMELDELKKMKDSVETAARDVQSSMQSTADGFEQSWAEATSALEQAATPVEVPSMVVFPEYKHPGRSGVSSKAPCPSGSRRGLACGLGLNRALPEWRGSVPALRPRAERPMPMPNPMP